jgi:hypothetical protein
MTLPASGQEIESGIRQRRPTSQATTSSKSSPSPVLVVGATGRVGRRVVEQLLSQNRPVRALVRNPTKAQELFGKNGSFKSSLHPNLQIIVAEISRFEDFDEVLEKAVEGCGSIISVSGAMRVSHLSDFLPWRLFGADVSSWAGRDHPYYASYASQKHLIELAAKHKVQRFVRLTGLSLSFSAFNPFNVLFNMMLSCMNRYNLLGEQALAAGKVPYVILHPGGLSDAPRNTSTTNVQVDPSGALPFPSRIGRDDVAALCVAAADADGSGVLPTDQSYVLACRWVGENMEPKPQGAMGDGFSTVSECLERLVQMKPAPPPYPEMKPYRLAVALTFYTFMVVSVKVGMGVWGLAKKSIRP